nr:hypothetical protein [Tanacetum cinerariifolium]
MSAIYNYFHHVLGLFDATASSFLEISKAFSIKGVIGGFGNDEVGLQWMLSLYNNKLNVILVNEMGLGKTVQALYSCTCCQREGLKATLIATERNNKGISTSCIYYVGNKDQRAKLFSQEVCHMRFNVLVTTMNLSCLISLNFRELIGKVASSHWDPPTVFHDWFSQPFQKEVSHNREDDWLETEKKFIIIHRLHQILEPFMLRRRVEDVEGSLPPKDLVFYLVKTVDPPVLQFRVFHESRVESLEDINGFLARYTPSNDLINTDFKQIGVIREIMLYIFKEFAFLLG